jgi:hypothetical protein
LPHLRNCPPATPGTASCHSERVTAGGGEPLNAKAPVKGALSAGNLVSAYKLDRQAPPTPVTVGIVDAYDTPSAAGDMAAYRQFYGLPACTTESGCFRRLNQSGGTTLPTTQAANWTRETSLDLDMVSATCPGCRIVLIETNSNNLDDLFAGVDAAIAAGATVVSLSFGSPEGANETTWEAKLNRPGVQIVVSAGDDGYGTGYPAASQYVTSAGGTVLTADSKTTRGWKETVWGSSGGGCTRYIPKPRWQTDTSCANRTDNDIAAAASNLSVYNSQQSSSKPWTVESGTSASAPIIAGIYALNGAQTNGAGMLYQADDGLFDITSGTLKGSNNKNCKVAYLCAATQFYDAPTGWGTPNGTAAFRTVSGRRNVLIFGDADAAEDGSGVANPTAALTSGGYTVAYSPQLPPDLSQYGQVWWYGIDALTDDMRQALVTYARNGGSLFLTGEWDGCCNTPSNDESVAYIFDRLVVTVGGLQFAPDPWNSTYPVNSSAINLAAYVPNTLTSFRGSALGGITGSNLGSDHFLVADDAGSGVVALWNEADVFGGGRLAVVMDVNWAQTYYGDMNTMPALAQNIAYFLSGANTPPAVTGPTSTFQPASPKLGPGTATAASHRQR